MSIERKSNPLIRFSIRNSLFVNLLTLFILLAGVMAMMGLRREVFPPVNFDIVTISTTYPGAPPEDVEKFVTIPIEKEIKGVSGIKEFLSTSEEGISSIGVYLDPQVGDKDTVVDDIKQAVERVNGLPDSIEEDPVVFELRSKERPIIVLSLGGNISDKALRQYAEEFEDRLLEVDGVSSIQRMGWRDPEFWVEVDPDKLVASEISMQEMMDALRNRNITLPGGQIRTNKDEYNVRITGEFRTPEEIEDVIIRSNDSGYLLKVKDVANVIETFEDASTLTRINGKPALGLVAVKSELSDVLTVAGDVKKTIKEFEAGLPEGMEITISDDFSYYVQRRLNVLRNNGIIGFALVLVILFLFLSPIPAFMTALGIPLSLFVTFIIMSFMGISINLISMFGLIIVLGMLVDDGIIVSENVYRHVENGMNPRDAALKGASEVVPPVVVTILTTCSAFAPLLFMKDIIGKFVRDIPIAVMIALGASLIEAFIILPAHLADFLKARPKKQHKESKGWYKNFVDLYERALNLALNFRYVVLAGLVGLLCGAIFLMTNHMKIVMFGSEEGVEYFSVRAHAQKGTPIEKMSELITPVEQYIMTNIPADELDNINTTIGMMGESGGFDPDLKRGGHLVEVKVYLTPLQQRDRGPRAISNSIREGLEQIEGFDRIYIDMPREGPPTGKPIEVRVKGEHYETLTEIANKIKDFLESKEGISDLTTSYSFGKKQLRINVDEEKAQKYDLSVSQIAQAVRSAFYGGLATTIKPLKAEKEIDVLVRFKEDQRNSMESFNKVYIENKFNTLIPLSAVAAIEEAEGVYRISHDDGKRVVHVTGNVDNKNITSLEANMLVQKAFKDVIKDYPGYSLKFSGEYEKQMESRANLMRSFMIAACCIFMILAFLFKSVIQPFIVMSAIPFGLIGVIFAFFLHGKPLSFFAFMGLIGLAGIVVNDSVVLVDFINRLRRDGHDRRESLVMGAKTRMRPVIMTTLTTVGGLMTVAYGWGGSDPFLRPMALAIVWGLLFATQLILVVIPCLYAIFDDLSMGCKKGYCLLSGKQIESVPHS